MAPKTRQHLVSLSLCLATLAGAPLLSGCRVTEQDVHRWETTELGPGKLGAVVMHEKYPLALRVEAAMGLIRMKPRSGKRVGLEKLLDSLKDVAPEERKRLLSGPNGKDGLIAKLVSEMDAPVTNQQGMTNEEQKGLDPSVPFKDAAFGLLTYDKDNVNLVNDEEQRKTLQQALTRWATTDFDKRISISSQLYGLEQIFRYLGQEGVRGLPKLMVTGSTYDRMATIIAEHGDQPTKEAAGKRLVELAQQTESQAWFDRTKPLLKKADEEGGYNITDDKLNKQTQEYQDEQVIKVYASLKKVGGRPVVDYLLGVAGDKTKPVKRRQAAVASLEGKLDRTNPADAQRVLAIASAEDTPDEIREFAFQRVTELPREIVAPKLYELMNSPTVAKKWKIRWVAASTVLKMSTAKDVPEFFTKLPQGAAPGFALSEPLEYGGAIGRMNPAVSREVILGELKSPVLSNKLTALGYFYSVGKAGDVPIVAPLEADTTALPKTEDPDAKWQCAIPKAGGKPGETETKELAHIGDFVKLCVEPAMTARKLQGPAPTARVPSPPATDECRPQQEKRTYLPVP